MSGLPQQQVSPTAKGEWQNLHLWQLPPAAHSSVSIFSLFSPKRPTHHILCSQDNTQSCNYIPEEVSLFSNTANVILLVKYRLIR